MEHLDFLKDFNKRMEMVGRFSTLMSNSFSKTTWSTYGIETRDMQMNILFSVLVFIMENSLKEIPCTMDDIADFIDEINMEFFKLKLDYSNVKELARFIVDTILGNSGSTQSFKAYNYEKKKLENVNIRYIDNKAVYQDNGVKRISYSLTDEGYNMMLSTLELESNLKLTISEMLFKLHLEKADYNSAVNDIKNIFDRITMQCQKIQNDMLRIRRNALSYSIEDYRQLVEENMGTLTETREKFNIHRQVINEKIKEYEEQKMKDVELSKKEEENLENLRVIGNFLSKVIDAHQKIMSLHFDLKKLYGYELENFSNMTMVKRFAFRGDLYDKILEDSRMVPNIDNILNPLFFSMPEKIYNPNLALEFQAKIRKKKSSDEDVELGFDAEELNREKEEQRRIKLEKYRGCVKTILDLLVEKGRFTLKDIESIEHNDDSEDLYNKLIPTPEIFREVIIELLNAGTIDIKKLRQEQGEHVYTVIETFILNEFILDISREDKYKKISEIIVRPLGQNEEVVIKNVINQYGKKCNLKCSNVSFETGVVYV